MKSLPTLARDLVGRPRFEGAVVLVILTAALLIGLETSRSIMASHGEWVRSADRVVLALFLLEIVIRFTACWPHPGRYFLNGWNWFDLSIVTAALLPFGGPWVAVARLARVLRVVRLIRGIRRLQVLLGALLKSLPSMGYVCCLLALHFYVYAVIGVFVFRDNDPYHFGTLGDALLTLFRMATLEDWTDVMYIAIHGSDRWSIEGFIGTPPAPRGFGIWAVLYCVSFVAIGAMVIINLLVGVMVSSLSEAQAETLRDSLGVPEMENRERAILESINSVEAQVRDLKELVRR